MKRTYPLYACLLAACSAPDRSPDVAAPRAVASPLAIVHGAKVFEQLGKGAGFVLDHDVFRAKVDRVFSATAPRMASGVQRMVNSEVGRFELTLTPVDLADAPGTHEGSTVTYANAALDTDLILATTPTAFEEVRVLRSAHAPSTLQWKIARSPSVATLRVREGRVEALDDTGYVRIGSAPIIALDARGVRLPVDVRIDGDTLIAAVNTSEASYPVVADPAWSTSPPMANARNIPGYALQSDGKLFVIGGNNSAGNVTPCEEYDPAVNAWTGAANQPSARTGNTVTSLGTSLVVTGIGADGMSVAHWFTGTKAFMLGLPKSTVSHDGGPAVALSTSQVLVMGAGGGGSTAEIYQYSGGTFTWQAAGTFPKGRRGTAGAMLPDGRPILLGGEVDTSTTFFPAYKTTTTTLVYTVATKTWSAGPSLNLLRSDPVITKLPSGALLITGGVNNDTNKRVAVAELYDPVSKTFKTTGTMATARSYHTATVLPTGKVLIAGGYPDTGPALSSVELYDPATGTFSSAGNMSTGRAGHGAIAIPGGKIFVFGGHNSSVPLASTEIFQQGALATACTAAFECSSGNCVDAHCCDAASCPADATCVTGKCAKKGAAACTAASECSSGNCVDGFCCDKACAGQCEACDVTGKEGTCSPTTGAPHGMTRGACTGTIVGGECGSQCDGTDTAKCNYPVATKSCGSRGCLDGVENTVGVCDGAGRCSATPRTCAGYACTGDTCGTSCTSDAQCLSTHQCTDGKCTARGATCSADNANVVEVGGKTTSCLPFACKGGVCKDSCGSSADCAGSSICDGSGKCVAPTAPTGGDDDGGCAMGRANNASWLALLAAAAIIATRRARRSS